MPVIPSVEPENIYGLPTLGLLIMSRDCGDRSEGANEDLHTEQQGGLHEVRYNPASNQSLTVAIIQTIATLEGESMDSLQQSPLHERIDIGAVETLLFGPEGSLRGPETHTVTFRYRSYQITVRGDGLLQVSDTKPVAP